MRSLRMSWLVALVGVASSAVPFRSANACGAAIHRMVASMAISNVKNAALRSLLSETGGDKDYRRWFLSGSIFPDLMKWDGDHFHSAQFLNDYASVIVQECREHNGTVCKKRIAHFLGVLAHQRSDNRFDKYFVKEVNSNCRFHDWAGKAQRWTDNKLDQIAICKNRDFAATYGLTFIQDVEVPEIVLAVTQRSDASLNTSARINEFRQKLADAVNSQQATLAEENKLKNAGIWCETYLANEASPNVWAQCEWGSDPKNYYEASSGTTGSVKDIGMDVLPEWLDTTYEKLMSAINNPSRSAPTFSQAGSGMERELCRDWIAASAAFCK